MNVSYEGIGYLAVTMPAANCQAGQLCKIDAQGRADACASGDRFCGLVEAVENNRAAVQIAGFVKVSYSGTAPAAGYAKLISDGKGGIRAAGEGWDYLVIALDETNRTVTLKL